MERTTKKVKIRKLLLLTAICTSCLSMEAQNQSQPQQPQPPAPVPTTAQPQPLPDCPPALVKKPRVGIKVPDWLQRKLNQQAAEKCRKYGICVDPRTKPVVILNNPATGKPCQVPALKPPTPPAAPACVTVNGPQGPVTVCGTPTKPAASN